MMTERTALFLAGLSHQWLPLALLLPALFGAATWVARRFRARVRAKPGNRGQGIAAIAQIVSGALFGVSLIVFAAAFVHLGCAALAAHSTQCRSNLKQL